MDLATRKYRFIEQLMKIRNSEKIEKLEELMSSLISEDEIIGFASDGSPLSIEGYRTKIKESEASYKSGAFISQDDIEKKFLKGI